MSPRASIVAFVGVTLLVACNATFRFDDKEPEDALLDSGASDATAEPRPACENDASCGRMRCEKTSGVCVACLGDTDCASPNLRCDETTHLCVACRERQDCSSHEVCDLVTHRCLDACHDDDEKCPNDGFVCDKSLKLCVECRSSANCAGSSKGSVCDIPIGRCVQCTGNAQCPQATPSCDRRTGRCVACLSSAACATGVCDPATLVCRDP